MDKNTSIYELKQEVQHFCEVRDWDKFHSPKELAIGISTEAGELLDLFRFKSDEDMKKMFENSEKKAKIEEEFSDILFFLLRFAQFYDIDISTAFKRKVEKNNQKYPVELFKGSNKKYNE